MAVFVSTKLIYLASLLSIQTSLLTYLSTSLRAQSPGE